jgi:methylated-DNA-[protein]-cysteine S-methyltransferase
VNVAVTRDGLLQVFLGTDPDDFRRKLANRLGDEEAAQTRLVAEALEQINRYLMGQRHAFDLPLDWSEMEAFQVAVLKATAMIPYGQVRTYSEIAAQTGHPGAARAAGAALARNPMALVLPCHRVIGLDGSLHGYNAPGGIKTKAWLLALEGYYLPVVVS